MTVDYTDAQLFAFLDHAKARIPAYLVNDFCDFLESETGAAVRNNIVTTRDLVEIVGRWFTDHDLEPPQAA